MKIDINHVAKLANLNLGDEESQKFEKQLTEIITYIERLNEVDTKDIEPTAQVTGLVNVFRKDENKEPSLSQEEALQNAKEKHNGFFKVKAILENKDF